MSFLVFGLFLVWFLYHIYLKGMLSEKYYIVWIASILVIFAIGIGLAKIKRAGRYKSVERRHFTYQIRKDILHNQNNKCAMCDDNLSPDTTQYDHIDGDRSNNDVSNCQALCSNCHSKKTRSS